MTQAKTPSRKPTAKPAMPAAVEPAAVAVEPAAVAAAEPAVASAPAAKAEAPAIPGFEFPKFEIPGFEMPKLEMPKLDMPNFDLSAFAQAEIPAVFRDFAEKAVAQAKTSFGKLKEAAEEATDAIEDTYETARSGLLELNGKSLDAVKANSDAMYGFAKSLLAVKTFAEAIELQSTFVRQQFETISAQAKELQEMAGKVASETSKPAKDALAKTVVSFKSGE